MSELGVLLDFTSPVSALGFTISSSKLSTQSIFHEFFVISHHGGITALSGRLRLKSN